MASGNIHLLPVDSEINISLLREFRHLLQTSISPHGSIKIIVTGGGYVEAVASSVRLFQRLELQSPICRMIAQTLPDHGCIFGVLVSHMLEQFYSCTSISAHMLSESVYVILQELKKFLMSTLISKRIDFTTVHNSFFPFVRTIITSKYTLGWSKHYIENLCIEIIKVFLNTIDCQNNVIGKVYVKIEKTVDSFFSYSGLLCDVDINSVKNITQLTGGVKIIVFTFKIEDGSDDCLVTDNSQIMPILLEAIKTGVKIVACQKYISSKIKLFLLRRNLLFFERMGTEMTSLLVNMSQALPISTSNLDLCKLDKMIGNISNIQHIQLNNNNYVLLSVNNSLVGTLLMPYSNPGGTDILKVLTQQAVDMLQIFVTHPIVAVGAGCLETWLVAQLEMIKENRRDQEVKLVSHWIQRALFSACGMFPPVRLDSVYHHGWSEEDHCRCGVVTATMLRQVDSDFIFLSEIINSELSIKLVPPQQPNTNVDGFVLIDLHYQKVNVILSALEMCINLFNVGLFVHTE